MTTSHKAYYTKYFILALTFIVLFSVGVSAVECDEDFNGLTGYGNQPCTVSTDLTLNGTYSINLERGVSGQQITINADNVILDCNNSYIYGNATSGGIGIYSNKQNSTIKNCHLSNYTTLLRTDGSAYNITYINNTLDVIDRGIDFSGGSFHNVLNNTFNPIEDYYALLNIRSNVANLNIFGNFFDGGYLNGFTASQGYLISNNNLSDSIIQENNFTNCFGVLGCIKIVTESKNNLIDSNNFYNNNYSIVLTAGSNETISNNYFFNQTYIDLSVSGDGVDNLFILNNTFKQVHKLASIFSSKNITYNGNIMLSGDNGVIIQLNNDFGNLDFKNNIFYDQEKLLVPSPSNGFNDYLYIPNLNTGQINISGNSFYNSSKSMTLRNSLGSTEISNNLFENIFGNQDGYNVGFISLNSKNLNIINNNFSNIGCSGFVAINLSNALVKENVFYYDLDYSINENTNCQLEPITGFSIVEIWKTWTSDGTESPSDTLENKIRYYRNYNITIQDNSFFNLPVYVKLQGVFNYTQDFQNYWLSSYQSPTYLVDETNLFINNGYDNAWTTFNETNGNPVIYSDNLGEGYMGFSPNSGKYKMYFKFYKTYFYFQNVNLTETYNTTVFEQTNALIFNTNGSIIGSSNIADNDGNINITLSPGNASCVRDDYTLIEGGYTGTCEPFSFSYSSLHSNDDYKVITSTLTESVYNVTSTITTSCGVGAKITYTSGSTSTEFLPEDYTCSGGTATLVLPEIQSGNDNVFEIEYTCSAFTRTGNRIIGLFMALILPFSVFYFIRKKGWDNLQLGDIVILFIAIVIGAGLYLSSSQLLGGICGAVVT